MFSSKSQISPKEMNTFIQERCSEVIKGDSKYIIRKDFLF